MAAELTADQRAMLAVFAAASAPMGMFDSRDALLPPPSTLDGRTREYRQWQERSAELLRTCVGLWKAGLIRESDDYDGTGSDSVITDAGRDALADDSPQRTNP